MFHPYDSHFRCCCHHGCCPPGCCHHSCCRPFASNSAEQITVNIPLTALLNRERPLQLVLEDESRAPAAPRAPPGRDATSQESSGSSGASSPRTPSSQQPGATSLRTPPGPSRSPSSRTQPVPPSSRTQPEPPQPTTTLARTQIVLPQVSASQTNKQKMSSMHPVAREASSNTSTLTFTPVSLPYTRTTPSATCSAQTQNVSFSKPSTSATVPLAQPSTSSSSWLQANLMLKEDLKLSDISSGDEDEVKVVKSNLSSFKRMNPCDKPRKIGLIEAPTEEVGVRKRTQPLKISSMGSRKKKDLHDQKKDKEDN